LLSSWLAPNVMGGQVLALTEDGIATAQGGRR
jgi:hypothetical protein